MPLTDIDNKTDEELVVLTLKNQEYLGELLKRYQEKLIRYVIRISGVALEEAEDIVQEVFLKAYLNLNDFDTSLKFSSWIYRIAHNEAISHFRKRQARPQTIEFDLANDHLAELASDFSIIKEVDQRLFNQTINQVLEELDEKYREVLVLKFLEGYDYTDISNILKKPMGTVATLINRAKAQFRKKAAASGVKFK